MADDPQHDALIGQTLLDKLKVIRKLGGGGMGAVYEVEHLITGHRRALKLIKPEYVKRKSFMKRLIREAGVAGRLQTPYVVETFDAGTMEDGSAYVLMELLDGQLLIDLLEKQEILPIERLVGIVVQICEGVSVAHSAGIIHRDLKPENIFLLSNPSGGGERVKILDFGISKFRDNKDGTSRLTQEGTILGTPFYMSPEQAAGREVDERTDIYSVGVMMYEALTGRLPFDAKSVGALFIKIAAGEYIPLRHYRPDVPEELEAVIDRAMHRDRDKRFPTIESLRTELVPYAPGELRIRTKTISDSPKPSRRTVGYEEVPKPAPVPTSDTVSMGAPPPRRPDADSMETIAAADSDPPTQPEVGLDDRAPVDSVVEPPARGPNRLTWVAAAGIVFVATIAAVAIATSGSDDAVAPAPEPAEVANGPTPAAEQEDEGRASPESEPPADPEPEPEPAAEERIASDAPEEPASEEPLAEEPSSDTPRRPPVRPIRRPVDRGGPPTPAERAGLDPNPYGSR